MTEPDAESLLKWYRLIEWLQKFERVGVALSGGVDSALVCCAAVEALDKGQVTAFTIVSPMEIPQEVADASQIAEQLGLERDSHSDG